MKECYGGKAESPMASKLGGPKRKMTPGSMRPPHASVTPGRGPDSSPGSRHAPKSHKRSY